MSVFVFVYAAALLVFIYAAALAGLLSAVRPMVGRFLGSGSMALAYVGGLAGLAMQSYGGLLVWRSGLVDYAVFVWCASPVLVVLLWVQLAVSRATVRVPGDDGGSWLKLVDES